MEGVAMAQGEAPAKEELDRPTAWPQSVRATHAQTHGRHHDGISRAKR